MKPRILVIDDEAGIRDSLKMILEYEGYECLLAATGPDGITLAEREPLDLDLPRHQDAGHRRPRGARAAAGAQRHAADRHDLRPRHRQHGGRGDPQGRVRFRREAALERSRAAHHSQRARPGAVARRERDAAARRRGASRDRRRERGSRACPRCHRPCGADQRDRARPRRERRRQGAGRARDPPQQPAGPRARSCRSTAPPSPRS